ncbi:LSU ribosomal protein L29p (L35e) [Mycoplasmopsis meleagridis]|uniref:Large ribosomal subunit protein uL29 n=1 Tax=Mycoplasmopsis meleagridis ATCC 25294 TaxID=1264554 RepID=A0A0F5H1J5_9BACT|nr:50S ribosomal protein L29 [Mycoplasmopsis meleagridis]KKB27053.1 LSU ribosomal protein L29p (L35e) [Mycoplasmopsis meleagridis ATCC 25294]OAD18446.1 LSU ribosomal protein L29p (L35e) [Mycoplasmopsis meleagridis]VEU77358.1 50S ribosomal protein L29 [Mycoplasmopsis meleagridis]
MLFKDLKDKKIDELQKLLVDLRAELWTLKFKNKTTSLEQSHKIKLVRRDIAKILTAIKQLELKGAK